MDDSNRELVSEFMLNLKNAVDQEKKNIGKKATTSEYGPEIRERFKEIAYYDIDPFKKDGPSKIIDSIIDKDKLIG